MRLSFHSINIYNCSNMHKYLKVKYLILLLLIFLAIGKIIDWTIPRGLSKKEILQQIRYETLESKSKQYIKNRKLRRTKNEETSKNITKDSLFIWTTNRHYRDSIRSIINPS